MISNWFPHDIANFHQFQAVPVFYGHCHDPRNVVNSVVSQAHCVVSRKTGIVTATKSSLVSDQWWLPQELFVDNGYDTKVTYSVWLRDSTVKLKIPILSVNQYLWFKISCENSIFLQQYRRETVLIRRLCSTQQTPYQLVSYHFRGRIIAFQ